MIKAEIFSSNGKITGFSISGHSGTASRGQDIYCAGISTVAQAAYMCITDHLKREIEGSQGDGRLSLRLKNLPDELTEAVFQTMLIGIREIERLAPKSVKLVAVLD